MKSNVIITANPATGEVFTSTGVSSKDGKEYGFIRMEQKVIDLDSAVASVKSISALKSISREAFDISGMKAGDAVEGKIQVLESLEANPNRKNQAPKTAGKDGGICLFNGQPIYRETRFTSDLNAKDVTIKHTSIAPVTEAVDAFKAQLNG